MNEYEDAKRELLELLEDMPEEEQQAFLKVVKFLNNRPPESPRLTEQEFNDLMDAAKQSH